MDKKRKFIKAHPYSVIRHLKISVLLVLITVLQQFLIRPRGIIALIGSLGINALYVIVILSYYISVYGNFRYRLENRAIHIHSGIFRKKDYVIPYSRILTYVFYTNVLSVMFGAAKVSVDTPAGSGRSHDVSIYCSLRRAREVRERILGKEKRKPQYRARTLSILLMSAFWSNPVTGFVFIVPTIVSAGNILGTEARNNIVLNSLNYRDSIIAEYVSPVAAFLASVIMMAWAVSMLLFFMRYANFCSYRVDQKLVVSRGLLSRCTTVLDMGAVSYVSIDKSLLMRLLKLQSCTVSVIGSGKMKGDIGMIVCPEEKKKAERNIRRLTGIVPRESNIVKPAKFSIYSYIYLPLYVLIGFIILYYLSGYMPFLRETTVIFTQIFSAVSVWWLLFRIYSYRNARIGLCGRCITLCGFRRLTLKHYFIPMDKIQWIEISRTPFQIKKGTCNFRVHLYSEKNVTCYIKQLPIAEVRAFLSKCRLRTAYPAVHDLPIDPSTY